jgi:histidyl-tRNA synthetase
MELQPVKGMRDFYPEQMFQRSWLFEKFRQTAQRFDFFEYDACVLEHEELYIRKSGEEITDQLYCFEDKGGRRLALRPELTPSLARMIIARRDDAVFPLRWFSIAQCFRYEKMQKGRKREHYQWNMDVVGEPGISAELELLAALADFFASVGLTDKDVTLKFSNRKIMAEFLGLAGVPEEKLPGVSVIVDKIEKIGPGKTSLMLKDSGIEESVASKIIAFTQAADMSEVERSIGYRPAAADEIQDLLEGARAYGMESFLRFSPSLVRGLAYYTGTVFEAFELAREGRAICGGGRYDRLVETFGGAPTPMVGFGFGDVVISMLLEEKGLLPVFGKHVRVLVAAFSPAESSAAISAARALRASGLRTEVDCSYKKLGKIFARAGRQGFSHIVIAAPEELASGRLTVKDLRIGVEEKIPAASVSDFILEG